MSWITRLLEGIKVAFAGRRLPFTGEELARIRAARDKSGGDCELAAELLRRRFPGGRKRRFAGDRLLHEVYEVRGVVIDLTAAQYIRPEVWTKSDLDETHLLTAVESGVSDQINTCGSCSG